MLWSQGLFPIFIDRHALHCNTLDTTLVSTTADPEISVHSKFWSPTVFNYPVFGPAILWGQLAPAHHQNDVVGDHKWVKAVHANICSCEIEKTHISVIFTFFKTGSFRAYLQAYSRLLEEIVDKTSQGVFPYTFQSQSHPHKAICFNSLRNGP